MTFRQRYGLRYDLEWVLEVASDPDSLTDLPAPLLPAELDQMAGSIVSAIPVVEMLERYGELVPEDFAGAFLDGRVPVARFSHRAGAHERALRRILGGKEFEVREVKFAFAELEAWRAEVEGERAWFAAQGLRLDHVSVYERENAVRVFYFGPNFGQRGPVLAIEDRIREHFGRPEWLTFMWFGAIPWNGPRGELKITFESGDQGSAVCWLTAHDPAMQEANGAVPAEGGTCTFFVVPVGRYEVQVEVDGKVVATETDVEVREDETTEIVVVAR
ncbi:MAG: carboxypeptidase-like regulatory domain-containing protein [Candidatus Limnocylindrales bacterium]